jgi:histidinol-phosphate aminotransferase
MDLTRWSTAMEHGGPDAGPPIRIDFSTNAHPLGPNPVVRASVDRADRTRYPDPHYTELRSALGAFHGVEPDRIVVGSSASELIWRLTQTWSAAGRAGVVSSSQTFGEYLRAARALGVPVAPNRTGLPADIPVLLWCCNPDNPSGAYQDDAITSLLGSSGNRHDLIVTDLAYWPFRTLLTADEQSPAVLRVPWADCVVQLWSPNKLHGLTGVRGAYLVLPSDGPQRISGETMMSLAPSWVLGADGVALLRAHMRPEATGFFRDTAPILRDWKKDQDRRLREAGWASEASQLHYGLWRPPVRRTLQPQWQQRLRQNGIKLRDATSFDRPGWVRLGSRAPEDVQQLVALTEPFRSTRAETL